MCAKCSGSVFDRLIRCPGPGPDLRSTAGWRRCAMSFSYLAVSCVVLFAVALPPLADKSFCVAVNPSSPESSRKTVEDGTNFVTGNAPERIDSWSEATFSDGFFQCYKDSKDSALSCIGEGAKTSLSSFFSKDNLELSEGLSLVKEAKESENGEGREDPISDTHFGHDAQTKTVIDSAASYLSSRAIRWDMSHFYPGLIMRVGPTLGGSGVMEFVLEPRRFYSDRALGPSRVVLKQVVLPFLLGLKVSVASLVPLLLFSVVFLAKKALLMTQLSVLLSGLLGFGSMGGFQGHGFGGGLGAGLPEGNFPVRTPHQLFADAPVQPWAGPPPRHHPHQLFRGVNYSVNEEPRGRRGFRWEDKKDERAGVYSHG